MADVQNNVAKCIAKPSYTLYFVLKISFSVLNFRIKMLL